MSARMYACRGECGLRFVAFIEQPADGKSANLHCPSCFGKANILPPRRPARERERVIEEAMRALTFTIAKEHAPSCDCFSCEIYRRISNAHA